MAKSEIGISDLANSGFPPRAKPTILLVDDEEEVLSVTCELMVGLGYTVVTANGARTALEFFKENHEKIDAIFCDYAMPGMNGMDTTRFMYEIDAGVPAIICSGYAGSEIVGSLPVQRERLCFLEKPFRRHELALLLAKVIGTQ